MKARAVDIFFGLVFVYAAIVQYNDPDGYAWALIYTLAAVPCFLPRLRGQFAAVVAISALIWMFSLIPSVVREGKFTGTEIDRETLGLLIVVVYMLVIAKRRGMR